MRAVGGLAFSWGAAERARYLAEIGAVVRQKQLQVATDRHFGAAKQFAKRLISEVPSVRDHLETTPHLGALQPLSAYPLSRAAYVGLQLELLVGMKKRFRGLGLGSPGGDEGAVKYGDSVLTGLELAQTWALLLSWGHLFGTFATERALLYHLKADSAAADAFVAEIDPRLRQSVERIIESESFYQFVHALTAFRVSRATVPAPLKNSLVEVLALYLGPTESVRLQRLRRLYYQTRQLAYLSLHQALDLPRIEVGEELAAVPPELVLDDGITFQPFGVTTTPMSTLFEALDRYQFEVFFTGERANQYVLTHLREFREWWLKRAAEGAAVAARVESLWTRPPDWPTLERTSEALALKVHVPVKERRWVQEARAWHADGVPWEGSTFLLTYPPAADHASCSILAHGQLSPRTVVHIASLLAARSEASWGHAAGAPRLWRSVAGFGRLLLSYIAQLDVEVVVRPTRAADGSIGFAALGRQGSPLYERIGLVANRSREASPARAEELEALAAYVRDLPHEPGQTYCLAFLGQVLLVDRASFTERHELDGVVAQISERGVAWHFLEMKGGRKGKPRKQLERLQKALRAKLGPQVVRRLGAQSVGICTASWR